MKNVTYAAMIVSVVMAVAAPASAVIVSGTLTGGNYADIGGSFIKTNATLTPNVGVNLINTRNVYGLDERQGVLLDQSDRFWATGILSAVEPETNIGIGTKVASHLIFIDPSAVPDPATASGTVTFSGKILGYRWGTAGLNASTGLLGARDIVYGDLMQLESYNDEISFSGNTLTYSFVTAARTGDFVRVITAVPESATWLMLISGFSLVGIVARRRQRTVAA